MASKCVTLLKVQLTEQLKSKGKGWSAAAMGILGGALAFYSYLIAAGLGAAGIPEVIPSYGVVIGSLVTLFFTILKTNGILFAYRDYDLLMSLPVKTSVVITSRFLTMYLLNLAVMALVMIPMGAGYAQWADPGAVFYLVWLPEIFLAPLIPTTIATMIGAAVIWISSRFRHAGLVTTVLSFLLLLGVMGGSLMIGNVKEGQIDLSLVRDMAGLVLEQMHRIYPPAALFYQAAVRGNLLSFLALAAGSLAWYGIFLALVSWKYQSINTGLTTHHSKSCYRVGELKTQTPIKALVKKEWKRFYTCPIYIMNMGFGIVMAVVACGAFALLGMEKLEEILRIPGMSGAVQRALPFLTPVLFCMTSTTAVSLSLEGKSLWILKSLPMDQVTVYKGKLLFNLFLTVPASLFCSLLLCLRIPAEPLNLLFLFVTPAVYCVFTSVFGLWINLKFPNYTWTSETAVVKQGAASFIGVFSGMLNGAVPLLVLFLLPGWNGELVTLAFTLAEGAGAFLLWLVVRKMEY